MFKKLFKILSPTHSTGIDLSDNSFKFVELISGKNGIRLGQYGETEIPAGTIEFGEIKDALSLKDIIHKLKKETNFEHSLKPVVMPFDIKGQAIATAVVKKGDPETCMIVDVDKNNSGIYVVSKGVVVFAFQLEVGVSDPKSLRDKIAKYFLHWHTHKMEGGDSSIKKIILCGDISDPEEFVEYMSANIRHPVQLANVWINILDVKKNIPEMTFKQSLSFAAAIGVALVGLD